MRDMKHLAAVAIAAVSAIGAAAQAPANLPPAYPRVGATKILDNDRVQVWNIAWLKGHPSPLHRHIYDLIGVYYEPGDRMIISPEGAKRPVSTKGGDVIFQARGVTHIEEGVSDSPLRSVFVELKRNDAYGSDAASGSVPPFAGEGAKQRLDNERATIWEYTVAPTPAKHRHLHDAVVASIDGEKTQARFIKRGTVHDDEGVGRTAKFYVFEIK